MRHLKYSERGQVFILLVLAVIGLFAFAALAIDGAMVYSDRRIEQNVTDAAALAGVGVAGSSIKDAIEDPDLEAKIGDWSCDDTIGNPMADAIDSAMSIAEGTAIQSAGDNDFTIDNNISDDNGVTTCCYPYSYSSGEFCPADDSGEEYIDVHARITEQTQTAFAHLFFDGLMINTVETVARFNPPVPVAAGLGIVSLTDECHGTEKGTFVNGAITVTVTGGGMWSESCLYLKGGAGDNNGSITVEGGDITFVKPEEDGGYPENNFDVDPTPEEAPGNIPLNLPLIEPPDCTGLPDRDSVNGGSDVPIEPGMYDSIKVGSGNLYMDPGLYCVDGEFTFNGTLLEALGVTILVTGNKPLRIGGGGSPSDCETLSKVLLHAPPLGCGDDCGGQGEPIPGLLIYMDTAQDVHLTGSPDSEFLGTVYAPHKYSAIHLGGTSDLCSISYGTQLLGNVIKISGKSAVSINYDEELTYHYPATIDLAR